MAELAAGLVGAAATVGASTLATGSGFTSRHETTLREEVMDTRRSTDDFMANLQSGDVTPDEEREFLKTREEAIQRRNEYYESIESYKDVSWLNPVKKIKMKYEVRRRKRLTRRSNQSLRSLNESMYSGSDTSSICASSGSPPGSNMAVDDIQDWASNVATDHLVQSARSNLVADANARDIKIDSYTLSSHNRLVIAGAEIALTYGERYGLLGENGSGKSSFFQSIVMSRSGIPQHVDISLVSGGVEPLDMNPVALLAASAQIKISSLEMYIEHLAAHEELKNVGALKAAHDQLDDLDPGKFHVKASSIFHGLGFTPTMMETPTKDISKGWRVRVALAQALFLKPHLLLLDEPTTHLDPAAVVWLEAHLSTYDHILVIITHAQDFMDNVCTKIIHLTDQKMSYYTGNYSTYVRTKHENEMNRIKAQKDEIERLKNLIATQVPCPEYLPRVLQRMEDAPAMEKNKTDMRLQFNFGHTMLAQKSSRPVITFHQVAFSYSMEKKDCLYENVSFDIDMNARIAILGTTETGKSTLLRLLAAALQPTSGTISKDPALKVARYSPNSPDQLLPYDKSPPAPVRPAVQCSPCTVATAALWAVRHTLNRTL